MLEVVEYALFATLRQEEYHKFEASLCCIMSLRPALDTKRNSVSNKTELSKRAHGSSQWDRLLPNVVAQPLM